MRKSIWLLSTGLVALSAPAFAQDATSTTAGGTPTTATEAATPTEESPVEPASTDAEQEEVIVVTAQGRRQILQDVPISVTAVGGDAMENSGANDIRQLNQLAPSLLVSSTSTEANGSARIRGIGTVGDNPGLESSVAVFIDGVYRSRSGIGLSELGEIDRVEVLRGPQGTLFGRNASAGLIHIFSKKPSYSLGAYGEASLGNYDFRRLDAGVTGPLTDTLAFRLEGVWVKRDGFYDDVNNDTDVNNRNRWFTRGQLLFEPTDALSVRLIGDYTWRKEKCCGAVYVNNDINDEIGNLNNPASPLVEPGTGTPSPPNPPARVNDDGNNIINVLTALGQDPQAFQNGWSRDIWVTPGRSYEGNTTDGGVSLQVDYDFGGVQLTSITGYRGYKSEQNGDFDFSTVDILYRKDEDPNYRKFSTFSQELRLHGSAFADRLDWLVGGYFADEDLTLKDSLRFGNQYGRFASCRLITGGGFVGFWDPSNTGCLAAPIRAGLAAGVVPPLGLAGPTILAAIDRLDSINDRGGIGDTYEQNSRNFALFTHNIFHITDNLDITLGLRYTNERKTFDAEFHNDNVACVQNQTALAPFLNPAHPLFATAAGIVGLSCQGNSTAELEGVEVDDKRSEDEFTGTAVLSYKPIDNLLLYASYSRGYKAGGFNLDRSALKSPIAPFGGQAGTQALVDLGRLQFDPEIVDAFEIGGKFTARGITFNVAIFRQEFENFQLNTFDGTVFIVQNINGCSEDLGGLDNDQSKFPTAPNFNAGAAVPGTGFCDEDDVTYGVVSQGIELEGSFRPMDDVRINAGYTYASTKYRDDLVGTDEGIPLNQALRRLPGQQISNAPKHVATGSVAWTPRIGGSGMRGLFYVDARYSGKYNTGSDLFPQKSQEAYTVVNARLGLRGPEDRWAVELWAQNLFDKDYQQVAFNSPFQEGANTPAFQDPSYPGGRQIFSTFLAEPRTYGLTFRAKWSPRARMVEEEVAPPPPPPPPPPATQTCPDGSVILATDTCPPPPPPPPPPPEPERG
jgi:iron complex outermembrane receptor protein